jgi:hypothetical protein
VWLIRDGALPNSARMAIFADFEGPVLAMLVFAPQLATTRFWGLGEYSCPSDQDVKGLSGWEPPTGRMVWKSRHENLNLRPIPQAGKSAGARSGAMEWMDEPLGSGLAGIIGFRPSGLHERGGAGGLSRARPCQANPIQAELS